MAKIVDIPDLNLRAVIENALGKTSGDTITGSDMASLTELFAPNANISNLTGLEGATNLRKLHLGTEYLEEERYINSNSVSDLSPLTGLTNLTGLWLDGNNITDISPLVANTGLGSGNRVDVKGNFLNSLSINTHIPVKAEEGYGYPTSSMQPTSPTPTSHRDSEARGKASGVTVEICSLTNFPR